MKPLSSRLKLALLSAGVAGLVLAGFGVFTWHVVYSLRMDTVDRELRTLASRHPGLFLGRGNPERLAASLEMTFGAEYTNKVFLLLRDAEGRTLFSSPHLPKELVLPGLSPNENTPRSPAQEPPRQPAQTQTEADGAAAGPGPWGRGFGVGRGGPPPPVTFTRPPRITTAQAGPTTWRLGEFSNSEVTLLLGLNHEEVIGEMNRLRNVFLLTVPAAILLVGLGGWAIAARALRPLAVIADTAERVTAHGLDQRVPEMDDSPEARRVIQVLNRMMDRLETSFRQATRFSADASHELKTPLTIMQGELENALQNAPTGSREQQTFTNLLEETHRLKTVIRSLLLLAQVDAGQLKLALAPLELSAAVEDLVEDARTLPASNSLKFDLSIQPAVQIKADRVLLRTALFNLLHNAVKYNEPEGQLQVRLALVDGRVHLTVGNSGPGIPIADQGRIFERFNRVRRPGDTQTDGLGLGLSLAREILRAHGGELVLQEARPGWTCFRAVL